MFEYRRRGQWGVGSLSPTQKYTFCERHWTRNWWNWTRSRFRIWRKSPTRQKASPCDNRHPSDATSSLSFLASNCWRWHWINVRALWKRYYKGNTCFKQTMHWNFDNPWLEPIVTKKFSIIIFTQLSICFQVGSIESNANDEFEVKKLYYDHQKRKACAFM